MLGDRRVCYSLPLAMSQCNGFSMDMAMRYNSGLKLSPQASGCARKNAAWGCFLTENNVPDRAAIAAAVTSDQVGGTHLGSLGRVGSQSLSSFKAWRPQRECLQDI